MIIIFGMGATLTQILSDSTAFAGLDIAAIKAELELTQKTALTTVSAKTAIDAATRTTVDIQPPAGETWIVDVSAAIEYAGGVTNTGVIIAYFDGVNFKGAAVVSITSANLGAALAGNPVNGIYARMKITNALYLRLIFDNSGAGTNFGYTYSGVKL